MAFVIEVVKFQLNLRYNQLSAEEHKEINKKLRNEFPTLASKITEELKASFPCMIMHQELAFTEYDLEDAGGQPLSNPVIECHFLNYKPK